MSIVFGVFAHLWIFTMAMIDQHAPFNYWISFALAWDIVLALLQATGAFWLVWLYRGGSWYKRK
jgi:hypothetical protein